MHFHTSSLLPDSTFEELLGFQFSMDLLHKLRVNRNTFLLPPLIQAPCSYYSQTDFHLPLLPSPSLPFPSFPSFSFPFPPKPGASQTELCCPRSLTCTPVILRSVMALAVGGQLERGCGKQAIFTEPHPWASVINERNRGQGNSTVGRAFALHTADPAIP